jgi:hypothetical protein
MAKAASGKAATPFENPIRYIDGSNSSIGPNINLWYHYKQALIDLKKEQYFGQLADVTAMPK